MLYTLRCTSRCVCDRRLRLWSTQVSPDIYRLSWCCAKLRSLQRYQTLCIVADGSAVPLPCHRSYRCLSRSQIFMLHSHYPRIYQLNLFLSWYPHVSSVVRHLSTYQILANRSGNIHGRVGESDASILWVTIFGNSLHAWQALLEVSFAFVKRSMTGLRVWHCCRWYMECENLLKRACIYRRASFQPSFDNGYGIPCQMASYHLTRKSSLMFNITAK